MTFRRQLAEAVRFHRKRHGYTLDELAARCDGVSASTISRLENEKYDVKISTVEELCTALGVTIDELLGAHSTSR